MTPPSLVALRPEGSRYPFFFVPGGDGQILGLNVITPYLGDDQPFYAFQARGLDGRREPHASVEAMAADYLKELRAVQPHGPYMLGGLCIGGMVALEMAQQLRRQGEEIGWLVLLDLPRAFGAKSIYIALRWAAECARDLPIARSVRYLLRRLSLHRRELARLSLRNRIDYVTDKARKSTGVITGSSLHPQPRIRLQFANAYARAIVKYKPYPYDGPVTLIASQRSRDADPTLGWGCVVRGCLQVQVVPGDHTLFLPRGIASIGPVLREGLDQAQARVRTRVQIAQETAG